MTYPMRSFRLYMAQRTYSVYVAPMIFVAVIALTVIAGLIVGMVTGLPLPGETRTIFSGLGMLISVLIGFFISSSALAVNRTFATFLAFGGTRRDFWTGTSLGFLVTAMITAVGATILLTVERLTDGWFIGLPVFDSHLLGDGKYLITFLAVLAYSLAALFTGAAFGTIFRAFGATAVTFSIIAAVLVIAGVTAGLVWQREFVLEAAANLGQWVPTILAATFALACLVISYIANKKATI
ncbi:hypothetical protein GWK18_01110 [Kocuria sp. JC486]|uniref:Uncharacterized protein n=1 Tax=Kocuria soli TaxID=2485125 RepID=A0A3N3ZW37_9MICC|nr:MULTISPECIES: hypothetical protein [Kocuria]NHU84213.1 hypothetical protein [Kocuria sp. JC486]ROZ64606.1 hypothetical protein EDL96_01760 [Kocuria soli]